MTPEDYQIDELTDYRPPQRLRAGYIYRGNDGHWHHADGKIASRAERRRAGVSHGK